MIVIAGPTAIGKTALSIELANYYSCPILSFDSRQFYKEMSIGTAKPSQTELNAAEHFFINSLSINEVYTSGMYEMDALERLEEVFKHQNTCIAVGGSGLYINALIYGIDDIPSDEKIRKELQQQLEDHGIDSLQKELEKIDPDYYATADLKNPRRLMRAIEAFRITGKPLTELRRNQIKSRPFEVIWIGLNTDTSVLFDRINNRVDQMIESGLIEEVQSLIPQKDSKALNTVGYSELFDYFDGIYTREEAIEKIKVNSRRYAKRQITWFKKNSAINWFEPDNIEAIKAKINEKIMAENF